MDAKCCKLMNGPYFVICTGPFSRDAVKMLSLFVSCDLYDQEH